MKSKLTRRVAVIAGTTVLALSGGTYAVAHGIGGGEKEREAFLDDAAERLDVTPEELTKALKEAAAARIDQAVKDGRLTQEQADEMKQRLEQGGGVPFLGGPGGPGGPGGHGHHGPPPGMDAAADYLGLSEAELREQLMDGKSLADLAEDKDKSVDGLKDAMEKAIRADIAKAVEDKRLTQEQADRILEELDGRLDEKVERTGPPRGPGGRHGHGPGGPGFGPPPDGAPAPDGGERPDDGGGSEGG
jgi:hypothetical protein